MYGTIAAISQFTAPSVALDEIFTSDYEIRVAAFAAGGIASVKFYCEGNTATVTQAHPRPRTCYGGETRYEEVYCLTLAHASFSGNGAVEVYAEVTPTDPTIATRIIGPMRLYRKTTAYDVNIEINDSLSVIAGSRYQTAQAALTYAATTAWVSGQHVRLYYTKNGDINPDAVAFGDNRATSLAKRGHVVVDANGYTVTMKKNTYNIYRPLFSGIIFKGCTIDVANMLSFTAETPAGNRIIKLLNCDIFSSNGARELPGNTAGAAYGTAKIVRFTNVFSAPICMDNCKLHDMSPRDISIPITIGCSYDTTVGDSLNTSMLYGPFLHWCNRLNKVSGEPVRARTPAIGLAYAGAGTATYDITGTASAGAGSTSRKLTLKVNGTAVMTLTAGVTVGSTPVQSSIDWTAIYTCQSAVDTINSYLGASGWTATLLNDEIRFSDIYPSDTTALTPTATFLGKPIATSIATCIDLHGDSGQFATTVNHDNHIIGYNISRNCVTQPMFPSVQNTANGSYNCIFINNCFQNWEGSSDVAANIYSQFCGATHHVLMLHNTSPNSGCMIRRDFAVTYGTSMDSYCRIQGNVFRSITTVGSTLGTCNVVISDNVILEDGDNTLSVPNKGRNYVYGVDVGIGTRIENYSNVTTGYGLFAQSDFIPAAGYGVRSNPITSYSVADVNGVLRGATCVAGAVLP